MLTRRRFLSYSSIGLVTIASGCKPNDISFLMQSENNRQAYSLSLAERAKLAQRKSSLLGYPINMNTPPEAFFSWRKELLEAGVGTFAYNNVGNPFKESPIVFNTHDFERDLILNFAKKYAFPENNTWGFLSNSGTDSNMHGMYMGRTILKGRTGLLPKAYFTKEAHYSVQILRDLLGMESVFINTTPDGAMDTDDLREKLKANADSPALVVATIGTTFKGAVDPIDDIQKALKGYSSFLHLDAALFGGYLPHTEHAHKLFYQSPNNSVARYDSIAVSCHKFFGFPSPAGLFISSKTSFEEFNGYFSKIHNPEYIHQVPGTITCSRDAVKPAEFHFFSTANAMNQQAKDAVSILQNTTYLMQQMQSQFPHLQVQRANAYSNTLFFRRPSDKIIQKYSLATMNLLVNKVSQGYAHVVIMPHVNKAVLNAFLTDLE